MMHSDSRWPARLRRTAVAAAATSLFALTAVAATAAAPPEPTYGSATVDGNTAEWNLAAPPAATDFFSDMLRAGGNGGQTTVESKLYMRYDCQTHVAYALVLTEQPDVTLDTTGDQFVKFGVTKQVDATAGNDGTAPDFAYVLSNGTAIGWEASFPVAEGVYTDLNVHAQVLHGGSQTSAVPGRAIQLTLNCGEVPPPKPLTVTKTATASFTRTFDWTVTKTATPPTITTPNDVAQFSYKVDVTKSQPVDSGFTVSGTITVANPNNDPISGVTVTDELASGVPCALANATDLTIPGKGSTDIVYSCPLGSKTDGTNQATAAWQGGSASGQAPYAFGAPASVTNDTVTVTDAFNNGVPTLIPGGAGISGSASFTYTRDVQVPATGCMTYPNIATITSPNELVKNASASVEACRGTSIIGQPNAIIKVTKRGPAKASAGQVISYTIVLRNTSATAATSVVLRDVLPAGYSFFKVPAGAKLQKGKLVWNVGNFAAGTSKTVKVQVRIDRKISGTRCNTAVASAANAGTVSSRACTKVLKVAGATSVPVVTG